MISPFANPLVNFAYIICDRLLDALSWCIILSAIASWLIAFNIINPRNNVVFQIIRFLNAVTTPILAPFRRFIPLIGGIDITPVIAMFIIWAIRAELLVPAFGLIDHALGGGV